MTDLADLFPGYESHWIDTSVGRIFARSSNGEGPPLLLLHGYAQTNVMWHKVAPALAAKFNLILPDLPGYGWSVAPRSGKGHTPYDKRSMAKVMIELMEKLGHARFYLAGHDRGGRVSYRLALDNPGRLIKLAVLDIIPTYEMWNRMDHTLAMKVWHWPFLAQKYPMPEMLIEKAPIEYLDYKMASWTKTKDLSAFDPRALAHYRAFFSDPLRIHATCEDYRAGETTDLGHDEVDHAARNKISAPMIALWGAAGIPSENSPLAIWKDWAKDVTGKAIDSGHFLAEENPDATARALLEYFRP
jgi:haloacetate dehalogenase